MAKTDRTVLITNDQEYGQVADPNKLEAMITHAYDVIDNNDTEFQDFKTAPELPTPDQSVTTAKLKDASVTEQKLADDSVSRRTIQSGAVGKDELDPTLWEQTASQAKFNEIDAQLVDNANNVGVSIESYQRIVPENDDSGRLQRLINDLTNGGSVIFNAYKTYSILSTITSLDDIQFFGHGSILQGDGTKTLINAGNYNFFDGIEFNNCTVAINAQGKTRVDVFHCRFINILNIGVYYYGSNSSYVMNSYSNNVSKDTITIDNDSYNILITGNEFTNPTEFGGYATAQTSAHVNCLNGDDIKVYFNKVYNNGGQGIIFGYNSTSGKGTTNSKAIGNTCKGNGQEGITNFGGNGKVTSDNIVQGNTCIKNRFNQIEVWLADRVTVEGNSVEEGSTHGNIGAITVYNSFNSIVNSNRVKAAKNNGIAIIAGSKKVNAHGNNIFNTNEMNDQASAQNGNGILLDSNGGSHPTEISLIGNTSESTNGKTTSKYGIYSTSNSNKNNTIDKNRGFGYKNEVAGYAYQTCYNVAQTIPTSGLWFIGDEVRQLAPTETGSTGSKYISKGWICTTTGVANNTAWSTGTAYTVGQQVNSGGNVYECTIAGTSGSTAPTGTGTAITDGTVTWKYVNALAVFKEMRVLTGA